MKKLRHILLAILSLGSALFLSGCHAMVILNPKGPIAADEKQLLIDAVLLMLIIVIPVFILVAIIARRYRASNLKAKYSPKWGHSNTLEVIWWLIPSMIIVVLSVLTWRTTHSLNPYRPLNDKALHLKRSTITIQAVALRWRWLFIYPKQHIATINYVQFPVNTQVQFLITADGPMNSFQIPQLAGQIYAMNGMQTKLHLAATSMGNYVGRSVSFSGAGFQGMKFVAHVTTEKAFNKWVQTVKQSPNQLTMTAYNKLVDPVTNSPVEYFSSVTDNMFYQIIRKFMPPKRLESNGRNSGVHL